MDTNWRTHELDLTANELGQNPMTLEWLLTNGTGAYAMGTASGVNTRRYHGLLVATTRPPVGRVIALNQVLERLTLKKQEQTRDVDLTACLFRSPDDGQQVLSPPGRLTAHRFEKGLSTRWTYQWSPNGGGSDAKTSEAASPDHGAITLTRELSLHWKQQAATLRYEIQGLDRLLEAGWAGTLSLKPLVTLRDFHSLLHMNNTGPISVSPRPDNSLTVYRDDIVVTLQCQPGELIPMNPVRDPWWYDIYYPVETERGLDDTEDHFVPGEYRIELNQAALSQSPLVATLTVTLGEKPVAAEPTAGSDRASHVQQVVGTTRVTLPDDGPLAGAAVKQAMVTAADDFVVDRQFKGQTLSTILAGYPWFADWGRDTFISMPGLLLTTGRFDEACATLRVYAEAIRDGLVPNRFDDYDDKAAHYNAVDASLWFIHAALRYLNASGDRQSWDDWLCPAVMQIFHAYIRGTEHDIRMAGDALITAGSPNTQLTWMDAACDGVVFTPRHGKAVEINALWYSALASMADLLEQTDRPTSQHYTKLLKRIKRSFAKLFWDNDRGCLNDHIWTDDQGTDHTDATIRPNQIFAVSLPHSPLPRTRQKKVLQSVRDHLLTPFGLRTLPVDDPQYHGRYTGSMFERDGAYHRGTVWPWLIGPYAEAVLRAGQFSKKAKAEAYAAIKPLLGELCTSGLGQLHEIHEADAPHRPVGCIAQAWSVAEVLRVLELIESTPSGK